MRAGATHEWVFALNFNAQPQKISLPDEAFFDVLENRAATSTLELPAFGAAVLRREKTG